MSAEMKTRIDDDADHAAPRSSRELALDRRTADCPQQCAKTARDAQAPAN
jgi:hypothetical protein